MTLSQCVLYLQVPLYIQFDLVTKDTSLYHIPFLHTKSILFNKEILLLRYSGTSLIRAQMIFMIMRFLLLRVRALYCFKQHFSYTD